MTNMSTQVNIAEAKARLSALIEAALAGEEVVLARSGRPVARIVPLTAPTRRSLGILRDYGWSESVPYEAVAPEPEDAVETPLVAERPNRRER
jgi:prevent-host-death family protein